MKTKEFTGIMKKIFRGIQYSFLIGLMVGTVVVLSSCGEAGVGSSTGNPTITIQGQVSEDGSVYRMLALETTTNEVTIVDVDSDSFEIAVEAGDYALSLLDENNTPLALMLQDSTTSFSISTDVDLGTLTVDTDELTLTTSTSMTVTSLYSSVSRAEGDAIDLINLQRVDPDTASDNEIDVAGAAAAGDADGDLVPDLLDTDVNNDGVYDNNEGRQLCEGIIDPAAGSTDGVNDLQEVDCYIFDNLKLQATELYNGDGDALPHTDDHALAIHMIVPSTLVSLIESVDILHSSTSPMPAFAANGTVADSAGGYTYAGTTPGTTYPSGAWSSYDPDGDGNTDGYDLPLSTDTNGDSNYALWVQAASDPYSSIFQFKITLTTGTVGIYTTRLFYVFNTPPKVTLVEDDLGSSDIVPYPVTEGDAGTLTNPLLIDGLASSITLTGDRPITQLGGVEVCGANVSAHLFYLDAAGTAINTTAVQSTVVPDTGTCTPSVDLELTLSVGGSSTDLPTTYDGTAVDTYQVDFTVSSDNGDNTAEIFYFTF